jgi:hypothetical protein
MVKFPFGVGYVRPNAIVETLPSNDVTPAVDVAQFSVEEDMTALFGTKSMYILLRLYICLATALSHMKSSIDAVEYDELLNLASGKDPDAAKYDARCKKVTGASSDMRMFLNIPFLVQRCADALFHASDESDTIILSHLSQLQLKVRVELLTLFYKTLIARAHDYSALSLGSRPPSHIIFGKVRRSCLSHPDEIRQHFLQLFASRNGTARYCSIDFHGD